MLNMIRNVGRRSITIEELRAMNHGSGNTLFVDVREQSEWDAGHIGWFTHIPLGEIPRHLNDFLKHEKVIFICKSGGRSGAACDTLRNAGINIAYNVEGGMDAWERGV